MSTAIVTTTDQNLPKLPVRVPHQQSDPKFTAAQIEKDCPARLREIGRTITEWFEEARDQAKRLDERVIAINKLTAEAQDLCDGGGYDKFRELFCPKLGKSQAYVRLAIAAGKTTLVESRTSERERKRRTRANRKAAAANSGTVPEKLVAQDTATGAGAGEPTTIAPEPSKPSSTVASAAAANSGTVPEKSEQQDAPIEAGVVEHPSTAVEQTLGPSKPWKERASVEGMRVFTAHTTGLYKATNKRPAEHFSETAVSVEIVEHLEHFYTGLAKLMSASAAKPTPVRVLQGDGTASPEQSATAVDRVA